MAGSAGWTGAAVVWSVVGGVPMALAATNAGVIAASAKDAFSLVRPWYSFNQGGVHFIGLSHVLTSRWAP